MTAVSPRTAKRQRSIKQARAVKTRQHILSSAIRLFGRRGILATTMVDLAKAIRMTPGALYWHFPTKEDLLLAAIDELHQRFMESFEPLFREISGWTAEQKLQRFLEHASDYMQTHREQALFFGMVGAEAAENNERVSAALRASLEMYITTMERLLTYGQRETREFRPDFDVGAMAHIAIFCHFGVVLQHNLFRHARPYGPLAQTLARLLVTGVRREDTPRRKPR